MDEIKLKLRKSLKTHAGDVDELTLKMPSGRIVLRLGEPFTTKIEADGAGGNKIEFKILPALASEYLAEMSGHNADILGQMHALDVIAAFDALTKMLRPTEA